MRVPAAVLIALFVSLLASGCTKRITDFTLISTKNTLLLNHADRAPARVSGEDCSFSLVSGMFPPDMETAIDNAIEAAGSEYDALVDGVLVFEDRFFVVCYKVTGTPIRSKAGVAPQPEPSPQGQPSQQVP